MGRCPIAKAEPLARSHAEVIAKAEPTIFFKQHRQNCSMFVPIRAETLLTIDHQENVGKKQNVVGI